MAKTTAMRQAVLNAILRNTALQGAATVYMSLHSADPTLDGSVGELSGNGYARTAIAFGPPGDGALEENESANTGAVTFPTPDPADWVEATHFAIWSAASGGVCYYADALDAPVTATAGVPVTFPVGSVIFTET